MNSLTHTFKNGLRLAYLHNPGTVTHCGLMIEAGGRDEPDDKLGLAHFLEHVIFKGTKTRNAYQVLNRLEIVGGELNAYTTREETCVHASMLNEHFERGAELISDIVFHSVFPEKEIEKEKDVVLDEINSYLENPSEQIFDDFECQVFRNHPLGRPVLGTAESVQAFSRKDLIAFVGKNYRPSLMVFSYVGGLTFEKVKQTVEKFFNVAEKQKTAEPKFKSRSSSAKSITQKRNVSHSHFICGSKSYSIHSNKRFALYQLNNILGGPGMNSRLNMNIREKYGLTYHVESGYHPYRDAGLFNVYLAADPKYLSRCIDLINREFQHLKNIKISTAQLNRFKYQLKGQIAISQENKAGVMLNNAKSMISYGEPMNLTELFRKIDLVSASEIMEAANEILDSRKISSLTYSPA